MGVKHKFRLPMLKGVVCLENSKSGPILEEAKAAMIRNKSSNRIKAFVVTTSHGAVQ